MGFLPTWTCFVAPSSLIKFSPHHPVPQARNLGLSLKVIMCSSFSLVSPFTLKVCLFGQEITGLPWLFLSLPFHFQLGSRQTPCLLVLFIKCISVLSIFIQCQLFLPWVCPCRIYLFEELSKIMYISLIVWDLVLSRHSASVSNDIVTLLLKTLLFPSARKKNSSL